MSDNDTNHPDYKTIPIPEKPKSEFTWQQRRSQLYNWIESAGHPRNLERSQADIAREFDVSQPQISKDIAAIKEYEADNIGEDAEAETQLICKSAVRKLMDDEEHERAAKLQLDYYDWLFDTGEREKEPEKHDVSIQEAWKEALNNE